MNWIKKHYHRYMIRPIITKSITRALIALVIALLWDRFVNLDRIGVSRLDFGLTAIGVILMAMAWFSYLHLDGITPIEDARERLGRKGKRKQHIKRSYGGDLADYLDEEIVPYQELEDDEKAACQMAAFLLSGAVLVLGALIISFF